LERLELMFQYGLQETLQHTGAIVEVWNECNRFEFEGNWMSFVLKWEVGDSSEKERESEMMICYCGTSIFCFGALIRQNGSHAKSSFPSHRFIFNMWITCWKLSYQSDYFAVMWLNIKWFHTYSELLHRGALYKKTFPRKNCLAGGVQLWIVSRYSVFYFIPSQSEKDNYPPFFTVHREKEKPKHDIFTFKF